MHVYRSASTYSRVGELRARGHDGPAERILSVAGRLILGATMAFVVALAAQFA